jgi:iron(III) transport system ATP-binding protein
VQDLLDAVGLTGLGGRYPHQLSGGQQQRVALARALALEPRILLLDEPFASLDANLRASVRSDVQRILHENNTTAVLVTHDQDEALSMADLVAVLRDGRIAQAAPPQVIYSRPLDPELARFVGEANLVSGVAAGPKGVDTTFGCQSVAGTEHLEAGLPVTVVIRPEQIEVRAGSDGGGAGGRVIGTEFYGHDAVVRVSLAGQAGSTPLVARVLGGVQLVPDDPVMITVRGPVGIWRDRDGHSASATANGSSGQA